MSFSYQNDPDQTEIFIIGLDTNYTTDLQNTLKNYGYKTSVFFSTSDAIGLRKEKDKFYLLIIDLALLNSRAALDSAESMINNLSVPVIIIADTFDDKVLRDLEKLCPWAYVPKNADLSFIRASVGAAIRHYCDKQNVNDCISGDINIKHEKAFMDHIQDVISIHGPDTAIRYVSPSVEELIGYTPQELIGKTVDIATPPEDIDIARNVIKAAVSQLKNYYRVEHRMIHKNGRKVWVETQGMLFYNDKGELAEVQCVVRDITERKNIEIQKDNALGALLQSEEKFRGIAEQMRDTIFINDALGILTYLSPSCEVLFGYTPEEMLGQHFMNYLDESSIPLAIERFSKTIDTGTPQKSILLNMKRRDGSLFQGELVASIIVEDNEPVGTLGIIRDTTERKEAEEALARALDEKESLLRELQHRVKNSFAIVAGIVDLEANRHENETTQNALMEIRNRVISMAQLYDILSDSSEVMEIQLDLYLSRMSQFIVDSYLSGQSNVDLVLKLDPVKIDVKRALSLGLVANELITNAAKYAFPQNRNGTINLSLQKIDSNLKLEISDNGRGLSADFSIEDCPGLGIELVRMLVHQLDGSVELSHSSGTVFVILIPFSSDYKL